MNLQTALDIDLRSLAKESIVGCRGDAAHFAQYEKQLHGLAWKYLPKAGALGANMDYEDLFQFFCLVYTKCKAGFDESRGIKFTTYLQCACVHAFNKQMKDLSKSRETLSATSVDALGDESGDFDGGYRLFEDASQRNPEETFLAREEMNTNFSGLSEKARVAVFCLLNPPASIAQAWAAEGHRGQVSMAFILEQMDIPYWQRKEIRREIREVYGVTVAVTARV